MPLISLDPQNQLGPGSQNPVSWIQLVPQNQLVPKSQTWLRPLSSLIFLNQLIPGCQNQPVPQNQLVPKNQNLVPRIQPAPQNWLGRPRLPTLQTRLVPLIQPGPPSPQTLQNQPAPGNQNRVVPHTCSPVKAPCQLP